MSTLHGYTLPLVANYETVFDATGEVAARVLWPAAVTSGIEDSAQWAKSLARIFAAAPELADALKGLGTSGNAPCWCDMRIGSPMQTSHSSACDAARAALAKAGVQC